MGHFLFLGVGNPDYPPYGLKRRARVWDKHINRLAPHMLFPGDYHRVCSMPWERTCVGGAKPTKPE